LKKDFSSLLSVLSNIFKNDASFQPHLAQFFGSFIELYQELQSKFVSGETGRATDHFFFVIDLLCNLPTELSNGACLLLLSNVHRLSEEVAQLQQECRQNPGERVFERLQIAKMGLKAAFEWIWQNRWSMRDNSAKAILLPSMFNIIEHCADAEVQEIVAELLVKWVELETDGSLGPIPRLQLNEKLQFVLKLSSVKIASEKNILKLCLSFFGDSWKSFSADIRRTLQPLFFQGLRCADDELRSKFRFEFLKLSGSSLFEVLCFLLAGEYWYVPTESNEWLSTAVDILMFLIDTNESLAICKSSMRKIRSPFIPNEDIDGDVEIIEEGSQEIAASLFQKHVDFSSSLNSSLTLSSIVGPLNELQLRYFDTISVSVWKNLFPQLWRLFNDNQKVVLTRLLNSVLSIRFSKRSCRNCLQALIIGINEAGSRFGEEISIHPEILLFAAVQHNCHIPAIQKLERQLILSPSDQSVFLSLLQLLHKLSETDSHFGMLQAYMKSPFSKTSLALSQFSLWPRAQSVYFNAMKSFRTEQSVTDYEYQLWENEWVRCAQNLNQWIEISDYARARQNPQLALDAGWRVGDWDFVRKVSQSPDLRESNEVALQKLSLAIFSVFTKAKSDIASISEDFKELRELSEQACSTALDQWNDLPKFCSTHHIPLLMAFQEIVELQESIEMLTVSCKNVSTSLAQGQHAVDLKPSNFVERKTAK
jgi:transformation/transcription domain-associated protein